MSRLSIQVCKAITNPIIYYSLSTAEGRALAALIILPTNRYKIAITVETNRIRNDLWV